jgi:hypothetical protein
MDNEATDSFSFLPSKSRHSEQDDRSFFHSPALMESNPNAYFYRNVAPGETHRTGVWTPEEKRLFLEMFERDPPQEGKWGLFAARIPGRVGYQCRHFYEQLVQSGELKPLPGHHKGISHQQWKKTEAPEFVKWSPRMREPWVTRKGRNADQSPIFEYESSKLLKANRDNLLNMVLFGPLGAAVLSEEYLKAIKSHLMCDTQEEKDGLVAAYFKVLEAPDELQEDLGKGFVEFVVKSVH